MSAFLSSETFSFYNRINKETMRTDLIKVFFRLDSPYKWGKGMSSDLTEPFNREALDILNKMGFDISNDGSSSFSCPQGVQGEQRLYMHPMDFSGILSEENYLKAKQIIEFAALESSIFSIRSIDTYELQSHHLKDIENNLKKQKEISEKN